MIRFTQATKCNDPFEIKPAVSAIERHAIVEEQLTAGILSRLPILFEKYPDLLRNCILEMDRSGELENLKRDAVSMGLKLFESATPEILARVGDECGKNLGILSLTEDPLSPPMWAHYAENHQGLVLEFDAHHPWFHTKRSETDEFCHLRQVQYVDDLHSDYLVDLNGWDLCYRKLRQWDYEREWRVVRPLVDANRTINQDVYLFSFPPDILTGVVFGWRVSGSVKKSVYALKRDIPRLAHLSLKKADLNALDGQMLLTDMSEGQYSEAAI